MKCLLCVGQIGLTFSGLHFILIYNWRFIMFAFLNLIKIAYLNEISIENAKETKQKITIKQTKIDKIFGFIEIYD